MRVIVFPLSLAIGACTCGARPAPPAPTAPPVAIAPQALDLPEHDRADALLVAFASGTALPDCPGEDPEPFELTECSGARARALAADLRTKGDPRYAALLDALNGPTAAGATWRAIENGGRAGEAAAALTVVSAVIGTSACLGAEPRDHQLLFSADIPAERSYADLLTSADWVERPYATAEDAGAPIKCAAVPDDLPPRMLAAEVSKRCTPEAFGVTTPAELALVGGSPRAAMALDAIAHLRRAIAIVETSRATSLAPLRGGLAELRSGLDRVRILVPPPLSFATGGVEGAMPELTGDATCSDDYSTAPIVMVDHTQHMFVRSPSYLTLDATTQHVRGTPFPGHALGTIDALAAPALAAALDRTLDDVPAPAPIPPEIQAEMDRELEEELPEFLDVPPTKDPLDLSTLMGSNPDLRAALRGERSTMFVVLAIDETVPMASVRRLVELLDDVRPRRMLEARHAEGLAPCVLVSELGKPQCLRLEDAELAGTGTAQQLGGVCGGDELDEEDGENGE